MKLYLLFLAGLSAYACNLCAGDTQEYLSRFKHTIQQYDVDAFKQQYDALSADQKMTVADKTALVRKLYAKLLSKENALFVTNSDRFFPTTV